MCKEISGDTNTSYKMFRARDVCGDPCTQRTQCWPDEQRQTEGQTDRRPGEEEQPERRSNGQKRPERRSDGEGPERRSNGASQTQAGAHLEDGGVGLDLLHHALELETDLVEARRLGRENRPDLLASKDPIEVHPPLLHLHPDVEDGKDTVELVLPALRLLLKHLVVPASRCVEVGSTITQLGGIANCFTSN